VQLISSHTLAAEDKNKLDAMDKEMREREPKLKQTALDKTAERDSHSGNAVHRLSEKDLLGYAGMAAQLGIALASDAALTRKRIVFYAGALVGAIGAALTAYTFLLDYIAIK
jgi:hypothetical protein